MDKLNRIFLSINNKLNQKITYGVNVIIFNDHNSNNDNLIQSLKEYINFEYSEFNQFCSRSLIYNHLDENLIKKYSEIIDIENNLTFRRLFSSLIPQHQDYLNNKYKNFKNLKNFFLFPAADLSFICLLYSLTILKNYKQSPKPFYSENFFYLFDNLTLTSACKLLNDYSSEDENFTFISTTYSDSSFVMEYKKFYDFNYIYI